MVKKPKSIKVLQSLVTSVDLCKTEWRLSANKKQNSVIETYPNIHSYI